MAKRQPKWVATIITVSHPPLNVVCHAVDWHPIVQYAHEVQGYIDHRPLVQHPSDWCPSNQRPPDRCPSDRRPLIRCA